MTKRYNVGDEVWYASYERREVRVPCPVCYGDKSVIVILGNGDEVQVECAYCQSGFNPPMGFVTEYIQEPRAEFQVITNRRVVEEYGNEEISYYSSHYGLYPDRMFDTESEAMNKAIEMQIADEQYKLEHPKQKNEKSYTWNAGYHMKNAASRRKEAEYHEAKAKICKAKSKEK